MQGFPNPSAPSGDMGIYVNPGYDPNNEYSAHILIHRFENSSRTNPPDDTVR